MIFLLVLALCATRNSLARTSRSRREYEYEIEYDEKYESLEFDLSTEATFEKPEEDYQYIYTEPKNDYVYTESQELFVTSTAFAYTGDPNACQFQSKTTIPANTLSITELGKTMRNRSI